MATKISEMSTLTGSSTNNNSFLPIVDELVSSNADKNKKVRISTHNQFYSNNFTTINQSSYKNYFGTGVDGDVTLSSSAQISSSFNNSLDGDFVVKNYKSLTINSGVTLLPLKRCRGLIIYCTGDLTVNGSISMTSKGGGVGSRTAPFAKTTETNFLAIDGTMYFNNFSSSANGIPSHWNFATSGSQWWSSYKIKVPISGSVAGGNPTINGQQAGSAGVFCCGGGGSGGAGAFNPGSPAVSGGSGSRGTIFAGGGGGGGGIRTPTGPDQKGKSAFFETGADGITQTGGNTAYGGSGAGNPAGLLAPGSPASINSGAAGLIILIVKGSITIGSGATVSSNGNTGGSGATSGPSTGAGGGGGSGGGMVVCIYGNSFTNNGSITVSGGAGGATAGAYVGGDGGAGTITIRKVHA